jgi:serine phosphatase RsbU (regulator of sigma subunit)
MKRGRFVLLAVCAPVMAFASVLDSVRQVRQNSGLHDTAKVSGLVLLGEGLYTSQPDSALFAWKEALALCSEMKAKYQGGPDAVVRSLRSWRGVAYNDMGFIYQQYGSMGTANDYYFKGLGVFDSLGDREKMANSLINIGYIFEMQNDYASTLSYYRKALELRKALGSTQGLAESYNNIGTVLIKTGKVEEGLKDYRLSLKLYEQLGDKRMLAYIYNNMAAVHKDYLRSDSDLYYFRRALALRKETKDRAGIAYSLSSLARAFMERSKMDSAFILANEALRIADELGYADYRKEAHYTLYKLNVKSKRPEEALRHYELYTALKDSISSKANTRDLARREMQYDFDKKEAIAHAEQEKKDAVTAQEKQVQRTIIIAVTAGLGAVLVFAVLLYNRFRLTRRQKQIIEAQKQEVEQQKELVEEKNREVTDSINYAKRIQRALLASGQVLEKNLPEYFILYRPKDIVSGDFYWAAECAGEGKFLLCVADCTGHGVPGAFMSLLNISKLGETVRERGITSPEAVLNNVRQEIIRALNPEGSAEESKDGMDAVLCSFDFEGCELTYAAANNAFYLVRDGALTACAADKMPVGKSPKEEEPFTLRRMGLSPGDLIYIFTDGYADQFGGPKGKKFKYRQLEEVLLGNAGKSMAEQRDLLDEALQSWKGDLEQVDDILLIGIRC